MILDLSLPRRDYFRRWSAHQILHQFVPKERVTLRNVQALDEAGKVVVVSAEEDLEALLQKKELHQDNTKMVHQVNTAKRDEVLVFAPSYRIPAGDSRRLIAYSYSSLLPLDRFKDKHKKASKVLEEAFGYLHQHPERFLDKTLLGWSWQGWEDRLLRVVMLMNDIKGQELPAYQNVARYKLEFPAFEEKVAAALQAGEIGSWEREAKELRKYRKHLQSRRREGKSLQYYVEQLEVHNRDIIRQETDTRQLVMHFRVPSRSNTYKEYQVKICNVPLGTVEQNWEVFDLYGECQCQDENYRSDRRSKSKEFYFCPHEIAAVQGLKAQLEYDGEQQRIHSLPFPLPTRSMIDFIDKLRYRAVVLAFNQKGQLTMQPLNDTEISALAMKKVVAEGYDRNMTADFNIFKKQGYDPHLDLIKFRNGKEADTP